MRIALFAALLLESLLLYMVVPSAGLTVFGPGPPTESFGDAINVTGMVRG